MCARDLCTHAQNLLCVFRKVALHLVLQRFPECFPHGCAVLSTVSRGNVENRSPTMPLPAGAGRASACDSWQNPCVSDFPLIWPFERLEYAPLADGGAPNAHKMWRCAACGTFVAPGCRHLRGPLATSACRTYRTSWKTKMTLTRDVKTMSFESLYSYSNYYIHDRNVGRKHPLPRPTGRIE